MKAKKSLRLSQAISAIQENVANKETAGKKEKKKPLVT